MHQHRLIAAILALALSGQVSAQDTSPETPSAETPSPETTAPAEGEPDPGTSDPSSGLDMGTPVEESEPAVGQAYTRETFGDWSLRCLRAPEGPDPCRLYQLLLDSEGNAVAEMALFPLPPEGRAAAGAVITAPLETLLTEQVVISVDGGTPKTYPFTYCNMGGCVARVGFTREEVDAFKRGTAATLRIVHALAPDQVVDLKISLSGFTAGFDYQVEADSSPSTGE